MDIWKVLKIQPTDDPKIIRKAYAEQLKLTNPEDDPDAFKKLRTAYEMALQQPVSSHLVPYLQSISKIDKPQSKSVDLLSTLFNSAQKPTEVLKQWIEERVFANLELSLLFQTALIEELPSSDPFPKTLFLTAYHSFHWSKLLFKSENPLAKSLQEIIEDYELFEQTELLDQAHNFTPLMFAAIVDDIQLARDSDPALLDDQNRDGDTAMHLACRAQSIEIVAYLIEMGANLEISNNRGETPLAIAIQNDLLEISELLCHAGANVNHRNKKNRSILYLAVVFSGLLLITFLCKQTPVKPDIDALCTAISTNKLEVTKILVELGTDLSQSPSESKNTPPLIFAIRNDHLEMLKYLLENGADPNQKTGSDITPLNVAAIKGNEEIIKCLLTSGVKASHNFGQSIEYALNHSQLHIAKMLLQSMDLSEPDAPFIFFSRCHEGGVLGYTSLGDDANLMSSQEPLEQSDSGLTELFQACEQGDTERVQLLLLTGTGPNQTIHCGLGPLHVAIKHHHNESVDLLLQAGADINLVADPYRYSPLFIAVKYQNKGAYQKLMELGAKDLPTAFYHTALFAAVYNGDLSIVKELIACGSDPRQIARDGKRTLVYTAARYRHLEILKYLLSLSLHPDWEPEMPPGINYDSVKGRDIPFTPLSASIKNGDIEAVQALLEAGADPNRLSNGMHPIHFAKAHHQIVELLVNCGAELHEN